MEETDSYICKYLHRIIVLILDGNSEIGAHVSSYLGYICLRHLFTSRRDLFSHSCTTCSELPYNVRTIHKIYIRREAQYYFPYLLYLSIIHCVRP